MRVINIQPAEKQVAQQFLEVHSIFYTIQGEGPFCGQPAIFVRLAGCNLQCPGCDTEYTDGRKNMTAHQVVSFLHDLRKLGTADGRFYPLVVITGGEPFRQDLSELVDKLTRNGYRVQIETNGTLRPVNIEFWKNDNVTIVCSPKTGRINPGLLPYVDAFKYVLHADSVNPDDGLPTLALGHSAAPRVARPPQGNTKPVYLQPMDTEGAFDQKFDAMVQNGLNLRACIDSCMKHGYTLQLQIHKIINME